MIGKTTLLAAVVVGASLTASAIPASLAIDFRDQASWSGAAGNTTYTSGNTTANGLRVRVIDNQTVPAKLTWTANLGLGVDTPLVPDDAELGAREIISIAFAGGAGNGVNGAWVTKLFTGELGFITETGYVELFVNNALAATLNFSGLQTSGANSLGDVFVDFGGAYDLTGAKFYASGNAISDYSVAGFTVPDQGTTIALLGVGLIGIGTLRRRQA